MLLAFLQEHGTRAAEHAAEAAEHGGAHGEHIPWIVEQVNHLFGPAVLSIQEKIMPPIYHLFGAEWHPGELPIPTHIVMFLIVVILSVGLLWFLRGQLSAESPTHRQQTFEVGVETIRSMLRDLVGPHGLKYFPVVATFATLILLSNLLGMLPDMVSPTANLNVTLALGLTSFLYYNYIGIRENGLFGHISHFAGPVRFPNIAATIAIMLLMFPIELISNFARILSLSLRLFGNIYGEEQVSDVISGMLAWGVPAILMPLGLLTAFLQAFIFVTLSMIYIGEVTQHHGEHGHAEGHGGHAEAAAAH